MVTLKSEFYFNLENLLFCHDSTNTSPRNYVNYFIQFFALDVKEFVNNTVKTVTKFSGLPTTKKTERPRNFRM